MTREEKERKLTEYVVKDNFYTGCPYCGMPTQLNDINPVGDVVVRTCIPCAESFEIEIMVRVKGIKTNGIIIKA